MAFNKKYKALYGFRRLNACKKLGWKTIPALLNGQLIDANINDIIQDENIRTNADTELTGLMQSIKQNGLLEPIGIVPIEEYERVTFLLTNIVENFHRKEVTPEELGNVCKTLKEDCDLTNSEISIRLGLPLSQIETALDLIQRVPEKYRHSIGYAKNRRNMGGKVSVSAVNAIMQRRFGLTNNEITDLMDATRQKQLSVAKIGFISSLVKHGMPVDKALNEFEEWTPKSVPLVVHKKRLEKYLRDNKIKSVSKLLADMLKGKVPLRPNLFF